MSIIQFDTDLLNSFIHLPKEQFHEAFVAIIEYANTRQIKTLSDPTANLAYSVMVDMVNKFWKRQEEIKNSRAKGGAKGGRPPKTLRLNENHKVSETVTDVQTPSSPNDNKIIKEEIINNEVNYLSDSTTNVVGHLNNNNILTPYNPPKEGPTIINYSCTQEITPLISEKTESEGTKPPQSPPKVNHAKILNHWNTVMQGKAIRPIKGISGQRLKWLQARLNEYGEEAILQATDKAAASSFLNGDNSKGWIATFDWFVRPNNFPKVLEGNYDNKVITQQQHGFTTVNAFPNRWEQQQIEQQQRNNSYARLINGLLAEAEEDPRALVNQLRAKQNISRDAPGTDSKP